MDKNGFGILKAFILKIGEDDAVGQHYNVDQCKALHSFKFSLLWIQVIVK